MTKLSHLAYIALGVVASEQPCSGYAVMKKFQESSSTYFSGSAGAIYPLLKRLEASGLVDEERSQAGTRTRRTYSITQKGSDALEAWISAPVPREDVAFLVDLLRARTLFFERLSKPKRRAFVKDAREQLNKRIAEFEDILETNTSLNQFDKVSAYSVIYIDRARLEWLDVVEKELC